MTPSKWLDFMNYCSAARSVVLVAPYIKLDALRMTLDRVDRTAELRCVTRWTPLDVSLGASDVACRSLVTGRNGSFRLHSSLHAKYYRADDHVVIGSANLTMSGLGFSDSSNLEILTRAKTSFDWVGFENRLLRESREVTDDEFTMWEQMPSTSVGLPDIGFPVLDLSQWIPQTRDPDYLWLAYSGSSPPSDEQYRLALEDLDALKVPSGLDKRAFDEWLYATIAFSPFVSFVLRQGRAVQDKAQLWDLICEEWDVETRAVAARLAGTVDNWARRYDLLT